MSLPKELNLGSNKPLSSSARPNILRFRSDNSSYQAGDTIRIEIPTNRQGQYLFPNDSFLEFKVKINASGGNGIGTTNFYLDQSIYSIFNRLRVIHGSTVLEDTLYVNRLWTVLYDIQINESERRGDSITKGLLETQFAASTPICNSDLLGFPSGSKATTAVAADSGIFDFNIVLPSSIFGTLP